MARGRTRSKLRSNVYCWNCGSVFTTGRAHARFCSQVCRQTFWRRELKRRKGKEGSA